MFKKRSYYLIATVTFINLILFVNSCKKEGDDITSGLPPEVDVTGTWYGTYSTSLVPVTPLTIILTQTGSSISGTYSSQRGGVGLVSGTVEGKGIANFTLTQTTQNCSGNYSGNAVVSDDTMNFTFNGSDCLGTHSNGHGLVMRNKTSPASDSIYVKIKLLNIPQTLTFNQSHVNTNYVEYNWGILFNTDGNDTTGLFGFDLEISIRHVKENAAPFQASIVNGTESVVIEWEKDSLNRYRGYTKHSKFSVRIDPSDHNTLIMALPRSWTEIALINESVKFYIQTYYIPPDLSYLQDETAVSSGAQTVSDVSGDVNYDFIDIISGGWNTHSLMKNYSKINLGTNRNFINIKAQYWTGNKWILKQKQ